MSYFDHLESLPDDPILSLTPKYNSDPREGKINLGVGTYRDAEGEPFILTTVRSSEALIFEKEKDKEYLQIAGNRLFTEEAKKLLFGEERGKAARIFTLQTVGGSGAIRVGAEFLVRMGMQHIYLSDPTWVNHNKLLSFAGFTLHQYPYYNVKSHSLDFEKMAAAISKMPRKSVILLHACCHNPTGVDPSEEEWKKLSQLIKERGIIPFFDIAYQGFKNGLEEDAFAIRLFEREGHEMLVASSFSKNMGLYGERVGALSIVANSEKSALSAGSQAKVIVRASYSNPPMHGGNIAATILSSPRLKEEWKKELSNMRARVQSMREMLVAHLSIHGEGERYSYLKEQAGLFSLLGIDSEEVQILREQYGIYMPDSGRINFAGLTSRNIDRFVEAIFSVSKMVRP